MRMKRAQTPPVVEWDFSRLKDVALPDAVLWEYSRTSDRVKVATIRWLNSNLFGKTVRQHLYDAGKKLGGPESSDIIDEIVMRGPKEVAGGIITLGQSLVQSGDLRELIMTVRPDFPRPWLAMPPRVEANPHYSRILCTPLARLFQREGELIEKHGRSDALARLRMLEEVYAPYFKLSIEWSGATIKAIVAHFEKWVQGEAKKHPEMKSRGKPGQAPLEPLKWLSAYRLHAAGFTFPQAQAMLSYFVKPTDDNQRLAENAGVTVLPAAYRPTEDPVKCGLAVLPIYQDNPPAWSNAIKGAKRILTALETGKALTSSKT